MKKTVLVFLLTILIFCVHQGYIRAISAESYCVIESKTGQVLFEKNADVRRGMASTTKIMTALVALESGKVDEIATTSYLASRTEGSSLYLKPGEKMRVYDLVCGLMLNSGNDAAVVLAEHIGGSVEGFVKLMNAKASEIGLLDTHFRNPNGLSEEAHYTTAYDLARLSAYAMQNADFKQIVSTRQMCIETVDEVRKLYLTNHNKLLNCLDDCDGIKTGYTKATGRCLVSSVTKAGFQTICVTLNAPDDWSDHTVLHTQAHNEYREISLAENGTHAGFAQVLCGEATQVGGVLAKTVTGVFKTVPDIVTNVAFFSPLQAPIERGQVIGRAEVYANGLKVAEIDVVAERAVPKLYIPTYVEFFCNLLRQVFCI